MSDFADACSMCRQPVLDGECCCDRCHAVRRAFYRAGLPRPGRLDLTEYWLPVAGHEGDYAVSSFGRIRSLARTIDTVRGPRRIPERILTPSGPVYPIVTLPGRGSVAVHTIMAETFLGPRPAGQQVLHRNGEKRDCWIGNLRYGSPGENAADAARHGSRKRRCHRGHRLTPDNVIIRFDGVRLCVECLRDADRRSPAAWRAWATGAVEPPDDWDGSAAQMAVVALSGPQTAERGRMDRRYRRALVAGDDTGYGMTLEAVEHYLEEVTR